MPGETMTTGSRHVIEFNEARDYHLTYILRDYKGNVTTYNFTVKGEKAKIPEPEQEEGTLFRWNQTNSYSVPGMHLIVPYGLLTKNTLLKPKVKELFLSDIVSAGSTWRDLVLCRSGSRCVEGLCGQ